MRYRMSNSPFIIWTFRRSGGTNLAHKLITHSKFSTVEHEPFNIDRIYKHITKDWIKNKNKDSLDEGLRSILSKKINFKHCLEIIPHEINQRLAELSVEYGYKHLFLYRENSKSRLLSLQYAIDTGNWGKGSRVRKSIDLTSTKLPVDKLIHHEITSRNKLEDIFKLLHELDGNNVFHVSFESVFQSDKRVGKFIVQQLFDNLSGVYSELDIENLFKNGQQGTSSEYTKYSNYDEFSSKVVNIGRFCLSKKIGERPPITKDFQCKFFESIKKDKLHCIISSDEDFDDEVIKYLLRNNKLNKVSENMYISDYINNPGDIFLPMSNENRLVSVIIPTYNVSNYIERCINSVIGQSYKNLEILVIDDLGQDDSIAKVESYDDERIRIIKHDKNRGLAGARNTGIKHANGEFILFLDSDDYIDVRLIEKCLHLQSLDDVDIVAFSSQHVDDEGKLYPVEWFEKYSGECHIDATIKDDNTHNFIAWDVAAWSKIIKTSFIKENNIVFQEEQRYFEDHYFSAKLYSMGARFSYLDDKLHYYYRRSDENNKSITQIVSPLVSYYRSRMMREVCLMLEGINPDYKNVFYPVYITLYKQVMFEAFDLKEHAKEVYDNLKVAFNNPENLDVIANEDLYFTDLIFLIDKYTYEDYINKFKPFWKFSVHDLLTVIPSEMHDKLDGYQSSVSHNLKVTPNLLISAFMFLIISFFKTNFFSKKEFKLRVRDFHIIRVLGDVKGSGFDRIFRIYNYVTFGEKYGDKINDKFIADVYLENNPTLQNMNMGLYSHYLFYGRNQRRNMDGLE